jgi:hypothetical protein
MIILPLPDDKFTVMPVSHTEPCAIGYAIYIIGHFTLWLRDNCKGTYHASPRLMIAEPHRMQTFPKDGVECTLGRMIHVKGDINFTDVADATLYKMTWL